MKKKTKTVFAERNKRVLIDFQAKSFAVFDRRKAKESGFWEMDKGNIILKKVKGDTHKSLLKVRGIVLSSEKEENIVLLRDGDYYSKDVILFNLDHKKLFTNCESHTFLVQEKETILDGYWQLSQTGSIILDPVIGEDGQRKSKRIFELRGLILQKENGENLVLIKK